MKNLSLLLPLFLLLSLPMCQVHKNSPANLPGSIFSGKQGKLHVQSSAVDQENEVVYFSFTDKLIKTDLNGNLIGSVTGFVGHLGDMDFDPESGKIYASLEFKDDAIGKGITKTLGVERVSKDGFYIAIFDGSRITEPDMDAEKEDLLKTVYLKEVVEDYQASVKMGDKEMKHRYACSGIDGLALAPSMGNPNEGKKYLYVAYGVYGDTTRYDNDNQVILKYDIQNWEQYGGVLSQNNLHESGPEEPMGKYFVRTGNTRYGIQNLAYDSHTGNLFAAVYRGAKSQFPNFSLFVIDGHKEPVMSEIQSDNKTIEVKTLSLLDAGLRDEATGIRGWNFKWGATGLEPLGDGLFYISHNGKSDDGQQISTLYKYRWTGDENEPFVRTE
jgi:hypothetical protein